MTSAQTEPLWQPDEERIATAAVTRFQSWAAEHHGAPAEGGYPALHRWSVEELEAFWRAVVEWFDIRFSTPYERVLGDRSMPGADWFPGATSTTPSTPCAPPTSAPTTRPCSMWTRHMSPPR